MSVGRFNLYIDDALMACVRQTAVQEGRTVSRQIERMLREALARQPALTPSRAPDTAPPCAMCEIPVTEEMVEAGMNACGCGDIQEGVDSYRAMAIDIYRAMAAVAPKDDQHLRERNHVLDIATEQVYRINALEAQLAAAQARLAAFTSAEPKPEPDLSRAFMDHTGDPRRVGG